MPPLPFVLMLIGPVKAELSPVNTSFPTPCCTNCPEPLKEPLKVSVAKLLTTSAPLAPMTTEPLPPTMPSSAAAVLLPNWTVPALILVPPKYVFKVCRVNWLAPFCTRIAPPENLAGAAGVGAQDVILGGGIVA